MMTMSFDLAISHEGDVLMAGNHDLQGVSGADLVAQRIRLRLRLQRGSWGDGKLGSNLHTLVNVEPAKAVEAAQAYTHEALRGMDDIVIDDVQVITTTRDLTVIVFFHMIPERNATVTPVSQTVEFAIPISGGVE
jgi:phage gp46-like protein